MAAYHYQQGDRPLEGYTIQHALGRGGFGEVYFALSDAGREVALKSVLNFEDIELRGIGHCMNLKSPHLVMIFDVKQGDDGTPWVIMEYVSGPSLRQVLDDAPGGIGPEQATFFMRELAKGIDYLHDAGIVHRDLKPHNIFFEDGRVKIGDYSLSKVMTVSHASGHTMTVGSVHYMAPEISMGKYDKTVDLYALGVMLFEMLTGKPPFVGESVGEVLMKHLNGNLDVSQLPQPFADVVRKSMDRDPAKRFQTAREMANALTSVNSPQPMQDSVPASLSLIGIRSTATSQEAGPRPDERSKIGHIDENDLADTVGPASSISDTAESPRDSESHHLTDKFSRIPQPIANIGYLMSGTLSFFSTALLVSLSIIMSNDLWIGEPWINALFFETALLIVGIWASAMMTTMILVHLVPQDSVLRNGIVCRFWLLVAFALIYVLFEKRIIDSHLGYSLVAGCITGTVAAMMILDWRQFSNPRRAQRILILRTLIAGAISGLTVAVFHLNFDYSMVAMASTLTAAITVQLASPCDGAAAVIDQKSELESSQQAVDSSSGHIDRSNPSLSVSTPTPEPIN